MFSKFELQLPGYDIQQEMTASVKVCLKPILTFKQRDIFYALKLHFLYKRPVHENQGLKSHSTKETEGSNSEELRNLKIANAISKTSFMLYFRVR